MRPARTIIRIERHRDGVLIKRESPEPVVKPTDRLLEHEQELCRINCFTVTVRSIVGPDRDAPLGELTRSLYSTVDRKKEICPTNTLEDGDLDIVYDFHEIPLVDIRMDAVIFIRDDEPAHPVAVAAVSDRTHSHLAWKTILHTSVRGQ